jgi:hypothetical protein
MATIEPETHETTDAAVLNWGDEAPRGGKAVMGRILKDSATVPLFFGQTLIQSLRDVGYNHTTSALCEHVDNAIQAGASQIRVYFRQAGKKGDYQVDAAVYDNGRGMSPAVLKVATSFGGSTSFGNRTGIGRFGMGMKTAALSMSPVMDLYSWQEPGAIYNMTLDVEQIGKDRSNLIELPEPTLMTELPDDVADMFRRPMSFPARIEEQDLLVKSDDNVEDRLGRTGTIVFMPQCDRLTFAKARTLVEHATKEMARVYRRAIGDGLRLFVNNRPIDPVDPTYSMPNARHTRVAGLNTTVSRLIVAKNLPIRLNERNEHTAQIVVKLYRLPIDDWYFLSKKVQRNDLRIFDQNTVSILRNGREVFAGPMTTLTTRHSVTNWYRIQIDFPGDLDEAFGVAANKQGVRLKQYVHDAIEAAIGGDITAINDDIRRFQAQQASSRGPSKPSASEQKASSADAYQQNELPTTPEEQAQLEENLRGLAVTLKRENETDEEAFARVKGSKYIITFKHDEYWPFYDVRHKFGRIILTVNTAHPFFSELYQPLQRLVVDETGPEAELTTESRPGPIVALELLLLSLARTQGRLSNAGDDTRALLDSFRREWSDTYRVQLTTT